MQTDPRNEYPQAFNHFVPLHAHIVCIFRNLHSNDSLGILVVRTVLQNEVLKSLKLVIKSENALVKLADDIYNLFEVYLWVGQPVIWE